MVVVIYVEHPARLGLYPNLYLAQGQLVKLQKLPGRALGALPNAALQNVTGNLCV
jgi:hypothetical protein